MIKVTIFFILSIFSFNLYGLELSEKLSTKYGAEQGVENVDNNTKLCNDILKYLYMDEYLSEGDKDLFEKKCYNVIGNIRNAFSNKNTIKEGNEFLMSILHMKSLYGNNSNTGTDSDVTLKSLYLSLKGTQNTENESEEPSESEINKTIMNFVKFNKYLLDNSNDVKKVHDFLVLTSQSNENLLPKKEKLFEHIVDQIRYFDEYFFASGGKIKVKKGYLKYNFLDIYKQPVCSAYLHLCNRYYESVSIYIRLKKVFNGIPAFLDKNCRKVKGEQFKKLMDMELKHSHIVERFDKYIISDDLYIVDMKLFDLKNVDKIQISKIDDINTLNIYEHKETVHLSAKNLSRYIDIKRELNDDKAYKQLMSAIRRYVTTLTKADSDITYFVQQLDDEDIERFLVDLNFFLYNGFLRVTEDKHLINADDVSPSYINLYRSNNIVALYILKTQYEENKLSEYRAHKFYRRKRIANITNDMIKKDFTHINELTNLPTLDNNKSAEHYLKGYEKFIENFEPDLHDIMKLQLFFTMAFKDCNVNQNFTENSKKLWFDLLYAYDKFGWFYVHPNEVINSINKSDFVRHVLVSRNFILKNNDQLTFLETQVAKIVEIINLSLEVDKSQDSLDFSIPRDFFNHKNGYHVMNDDKLKLLTSYEYIDSIANNYFFLSEYKNDVFRTGNNFKLYFNLPNIYSLAYQLFNELAININVITNVPLKKYLKYNASYAYFTLMNMIGKNHDIYSKGSRYIYASYVLGLVFFIESHIDIARLKPKDFFFMKQSLPIIDHVYHKDLKTLKKNCTLLTEFMKINKNSQNYELTHTEEMIKILGLLVVMLWAKEGKKSVYYDDDVSLYRKLMVSCVFNGGETIQEKLANNIEKSCNISQYGIKSKYLKDIIDINLSIHKWNPAEIEKLAYSLVLSCKMQQLMYKPLNVEKLALEDYYKLPLAPDMIKTYHCYKLGKQAAKLLESIILKKKFVRFRVNDAIDVYDFFYIKKVISSRIKKEYKEFLQDKRAFEKKELQTILNNSPFSEEQTMKLINSYECHWFTSYENFRILWMHASSNLGTGTYLKNFFSELWQNIRFLFKSKLKIRDMEYFSGEISQMNLLDYYSPMVHSESHCQEKMQVLFITLRDNKEENRSEIAQKVKSAYYQCKLDYYKNHHSDFIHRIHPNDFLNRKVFVLKQPYYLMSNIPLNSPKKVLRLFVTEGTLEYLLLDKINIPECFGPCTKLHFNRVVIKESKPRIYDMTINNALVPEIQPYNRRKHITVYINEAYIKNIVSDTLTHEEIKRHDIEKGHIKICMGKSTYLTEPILTEEHFNLTHKPVYDFSSVKHNLKVFHMKNEHLVSEDPNDDCFINYPLATINLDITDPYKEISEDLIKNLYILKSS
ncbi:high molecular weight rhoptry protein 2 [Plasmodium sp. gorilla clade G3]|nr:high molecular weight rhoptry protein 2 [Plasmodium sp. gorilla clade G3]